MRFKGKAIYPFEEPLICNQEDKLTRFDTTLRLDFLSFVTDKFGSNSYFLTKKMAKSELNKLKYSPFRKKI